MKRLLVLAAAVLVITSSCGGEPDPSEVAQGVSQGVMSPFCDGLTIHDCPSQQSEELRFEILEMARTGMSEDAIADELVARYGERIRGVPEPQGAGLIVWVLPGLAVVAGTTIAILLARRFSGRASSPHRSPDSEPTPQERARLDAELAAAREHS